MCAHNVTLPHLAYNSRWYAYDDMQDVMCLFDHRSVHYRNQVDLNAGEVWFCLDVRDDLMAWLGNDLLAKCHPQRQVHYFCLQDNQFSWDWLGCFVATRVAMHHGLRRVCLQRAGDQKLPAGSSIDGATLAGGVLHGVNNVGFPRYAVYGSWFSIQERGALGGAPTIVALKDLRKGHYKNDVRMHADEACYMLPRSSNQCSAVRLAIETLTDMQKHPDVDVHVFQVPAPGAAELTWIGCFERSDASQGSDRVHLKRKRGAQHMPPGCSIVGTKSRSEDRHLQLLRNQAAPNVVDHECVTLKVGNKHYTPDFSLKGGQRLVESKCTVASLWDDAVPKLKVWAHHFFGLEFYAVGGHGADMIVVRVHPDGSHTRSSLIQVTA